MNFLNYRLMTMNEPRSVLPSLLYFCVDILFVSEEIFSRLDVYGGFLVLARTLLNTVLT